MGLNVPKALQPALAEVSRAWFDLADGIDGVVEPQFPTSMARRGSSPQGTDGDTLG